MSKTLRQILSLAVIAGAAFLTVGCVEKKGPMEKAGEKIDDAVEKAGDKVEDAAEKIEDATDGGGEVQR